MHNMAQNLPQYFYLLMEKPFGHYCEVHFLVSDDTVKPENNYS